MPSAPAAFQLRLCSLLNALAEELARLGSPAECWRRQKVDCALLHTAGSCCGHDCCLMHPEGPYAPAVLHPAQAQGGVSIMATASMLTTGLTWPVQA